MPNCLAMDDESLYEQVKKRLSSVYRLQYKDDWEDQLHNSFIGLLEAVRRGIVINPGAYLFGIARCQRLMQIRTVSRGRATLQRCPAPKQPDRPDEILRRREYGKILAEALAGLSSVQRSVIEASLGGAKEVAGLTATQFRLAKNRGLVKLKALVQRALLRRA